jgi:hypothetical protein
MAKTLGRGERRAEDERPAGLRLFRDPVQEEHCDEAIPTEALCVMCDSSKRSVDRMQVARRCL